MSQITVFRRLMPALVIAMFGFVAPAVAQTAQPPGAAAAPHVTKAATGTNGKIKLTNSQKFTSTAAAQASCPADTVVWSSLTKSHSFHMPGSKYYGKTKHGAYVCEQAALAAGYHQARS